MRQLELFAVDQVKVRLGYEALEKLDIDSALDIFRDIERFDDVADAAREAIAACARWRRLEDEHAALPTKERAEGMWQALSTDGRFSGKPRLCLRKGLATRLIDELEELPVEPMGRGLHRGMLLGDCGRIEEAEAWYRQALEAFPKAVQLHRQLGDLLWHANRRTQARRHLSLIHI